MCERETTDGGRLHRSFVAIAVLAAILIVPVGAAAAPRDVTSTHTYLREGYKLARIGVAHIKAGQAKVKRAIHALAARCPNAAAGSPQNLESQHMSLEAAGVLWSAAYGTVAGPIRAFAHVVRPLRWSSPRITRQVRASIDTLLTLATLPPPDLCGDVAAWRASGYAKIPASTLAYDARIEAAEAHPVPDRMIRPFESPADRAVAAKLHGLEKRLLDAETSLGFDDWDELLEALEIQQ